MNLYIFGRSISISEPLRSTPEPLRPRSDLTPVALPHQTSPAGHFCWPDRNPALKSSKSVCPVLCSPYTLRLFPRTVWSKIIQAIRSDPDPIKSIFVYRSDPILAKICRFRTTRRSGPPAEGPGWNPRQTESISA
jgi:hypothetical protein